jgi:hypothetical protein
MGEACAGEKPSVPSLSIWGLSSALIGGFLRSNPSPFWLVTNGARCNSTQSKGPSVERHVPTICFLWTTRCVGAAHTDCFDLANGTDCRAHGRSEPE